MLFWKNSIKLDVVDSHKYYIDVIINRNSEDEWRFTGFYGEPKIAKHDEAGLWKKKYGPWIAQTNLNTSFGELAKIRSQPSVIWGLQRM